jgi:hypothetical protein
MYCNNAPTQLLRNWFEQWPSTKRFLDFSARGKFGRVCYIGVDRLLISILNRRMCACVFGYLLEWYTLCTKYIQILYMYIHIQIHSCVLVVCLSCCQILRSEIYYLGDLSSCRKLLWAVSDRIDYFSNKSASSYSGCRPTWFDLSTWCYPTDMSVVFFDTSCPISGLIITCHDQY